MECRNVILSGGKSTRMGTNKSLLTLPDGVPVIQAIADEMKKGVDQTIVVANDPETYRFLGLPVVSDRYRDKGPLAGLETALHHIDAEAFLFAACDMPFVDHRIYDYLLKQMGDHDAVAPVYEGRVHPLAGIYRRRVLPEIQEKLQAGDLRVRSFFDAIDVHFENDFQSFTDEELGRHFFNMNNPDQYEMAKQNINW